MLFAVALLQPRLGSLSAGIWGPESPWTHFDFLGAWWLWWASGRGGDALAMLAFPDGALPLQHHFPNPFDGWLMGPLAFPDGAVGPRAWRLFNVTQLVHHLLNVAAATLLARAAGLRTWPSAIAGALVAASPVMFHEIAGGRTLPGAVWPGLLGLRALLRGRAGRAGLWIGLQGLFYLYTGALFGLVALVLRPRWGLATAALVLTPYALWLLPLLDGLHGRPPPAGFTALPISGLLGFEGVPERFRLLQLLAPLGVAGLVAGHRWRWLAAAGVVALVSVGPTPGWGLGDAAIVSPLAWAQWAVPGLGRMHHPVRATLLLAPLLAVGVGALAQRRAAWAAVALGLALWGRGPVLLATSWAAPVDPPGSEAAAWLATHGVAVVDLTGAGDAALGLQPLHGLPMLEGLRRASRRPDGGGATHARLRARADGWLAGERQPTLAADLAAAGFSHVLVVERRGPLPAPVWSAVQADLGPPVAPGVFALPVR